MGSMLNRTMAAKPMLMDQNAIDSGRSFHISPGRSARRQKSIKSQAEHAVHAEQRGVSVHRSQVQSLHVVERDRRIDHEAEEAGAHEIPERNGDEEVDRPLVGADPRTVGRAAGEADVLPCFEADQDQRHDFEGAEHRSQGQYRGRCTGEVQVMECSDDASRKIDDRREQDAARSCRDREQLQSREQEGDDDGGEDLEEAFDPKVNDPPAPVLGGNQRAALAIHQSGSVEERNRDAGNKEQHQQRMVLVAPLQGRLQAAPHQPQPEGQADEEQDLPQAAKVDVLVALRSEPEPEIAELLLDAQPFAGERADDHSHDCDKQKVDAKALALRFSAANSGNDVEAGREP